MGAVEGSSLLDHALACRHVCIYATRAHICILVTCQQSASIHVVAYACMHACMHEENIQMHICIYIYYVYLHTHIHIRGHIHIHIYVYLYL